jgi:fatty acid desaturase
MSDVGGTSLVEEQAGGRAVAIYQVGEPLPQAVAGDARKRLSPQAREQIKLLMRPDPGHFLLQAILAWTLIIAAIVLAEYAQRAWVTALVVVFIATRQNILGLLMHEQCHRIGFRSRLGDYFCNFTCACPLLITLEGYRRVHLAHHQCYFTPADPDYRRKQGREWTFPKRVLGLLKLFLQDLTLLSLVKTLRGKQAGKNVPAYWGGAMPVLVRLAYYALWAALLTWMGWWPEFLLYWFLPLATVLQVIVRWGAICEHKYNLIDPTLEESTPIIEPQWWERILLPNLNFTLHVYHHLYPVVPYSKLPRVHEIFRREGLLNEANVFRGYGAYLRFILGKARRAGTSAPAASQCAVVPLTADQPHTDLAPGYCPDRERA